MKKTYEQKDADFVAQFQPTARVLTRKMIHDTTSAAEISWADPRVQLLNRLADAFAEYDEKLRWLSRKLTDEVTNLDRFGLPSVSLCVLNTSLIDDIKQTAAKIDCLKDQILQNELFQADDKLSDLARHCFIM